MKKQLLLLFLILLFINFLTAQTPWWVEDFKPPDPGWNLEELWEIDESYNTMFFSCSNMIYNFDLSAWSPTITLPAEVQTLNITQFIEPWFMHYPDNEKAEIWILVDGEEILLWEHELKDGSWGWYTGTEVSFPLETHAGKDMQVRFRTTGETTYAWDVWRIFNLSITASFENDLAAINISGPSNLDIDEDGMWNIEIINYGTESQSGFYIDLFEFKTGNQIDQQFITETLPTGESETFNLNWVPSEHQNTLVYANLTLENDQFTDNNTSGFSFLRVNPDLDFDILVWDNDNDIQTIYDPEQKDLIQPDVGLTRALGAAGFSYDIVSQLPEAIFLNSYEIIFCTMGPWCWN